MQCCSVQLNECPIEEAFGEGREHGAPCVAPLCEGGAGGEQALLVWLLAARVSLCLVQSQPSSAFLQQTASTCWKVSPSFPVHIVSSPLPWVLLLHPTCPHLISLQRGLCRMVGKAHRYAALPFPRGLGAWITCVGNAAAMIWPPSVSCRQFWGLAFMLQGEMLGDYFPAPLELCCPCFTWGK